jgi:hypothetical protein
MKNINARMRNRRVRFSPNVYLSEPWVAYLQPYIRLLIMADVKTGQKRCARALIFDVPDCGDFETSGFAEVEINNLRRIGRAFRAQTAPSRNQ